MKPNETASFQEQGSVEHCYGCGADNHRGLGLQSYWAGDEATACWQPEPHHCAASPNSLNGGIIASLIGCHCVNLAIAWAYREENRPIGSLPRIGYATASLSVNYRKPVPIAGPIELRARIEKIDGRKAWIACSASAAGEIRATGEVLAIRIDRE